MAPKPMLTLAVPSDEPVLAAGAGASSSNSVLNTSYNYNSSGTITVFSKSYTPYTFNEDGMIAVNDNGNVTYHISDKDIRVLEIVGRGASSTVIKGFCPRLNRFVAVKRINMYEQDTRHQMMNDIKALCNAPNVPGLVQFYGAYHTPESGQINIILEYMNGGSLADVVKKVRAHSRFVAVGPKPWPWNAVWAPWLLSILLKCSWVMPIHQAAAGRAPCMGP